MTTTRTALTTDTSTIGQVVFKTAKSPTTFEIIGVDLVGAHSFNGQPTVGVRKVGSATKVPNCWYPLGAFFVEV